MSSSQPAARDVMTTRFPPPPSRIARALGAGAWTLAAALAPAHAQDAPEDRKSVV